jgi:hypothetical protein
MARLGFPRYQFFHNRIDLTSTLHNVLQGKRFHKAEHFLKNILDAAILCTCRQPWTPVGNTGAL